jgi:hypothetical protein
MRRYVNIEVPEVMGSYIIRWAKNVHEVLPEYNNGYAFRGDWLKVGGLNTVQQFDIILAVSHAHTFNVREPGAFVFEASTQGQKILIMDVYGYDWARQIKHPLFDYIMKPWSENDGE